MTFNPTPPFTNLDIEYMRIGMWQPIGSADLQRDTRKTRWSLREARVR